jgi:hypothetical protein
MNIWGWIFMSVSWAAILSLFIFCLRRTFKGNGDSASGSAGESDE